MKLVIYFDNGERMYRGVDNFNSNELGDISFTHKSLENGELMYCQFYNGTYIGYSVSEKLYN